MSLTALVLHWTRRSAVAAVLLVPHAARAAVSFTGTPYAENFDTLPTSGAAVAFANDSTLPGWSIFRQPAPGTPIPTIAAGTGSSNTGAIYSFGASGDADRAFGGAGSGNQGYFGGPATGAIAAWIAVALTNNTAATINDANVLFDGEQWRNGGNASAQSMVFEYGLGATFEGVAAWTAPGGTFDFTTPITGATAAALDGNDPLNRTADLGGALTGLGWNVGDVLWLRWVEKNDAGNDHGIAVDDLEFTAGSIVEPTNDSDFDDDDDVDGSDFLVWQVGYGLSGQLDKSTGDADGDGDVNDADLGEWQAHFGGPPAVAVGGAIPEPTAAWLLVTCAGFLAAVRVVERRSEWGR